MEKVSMKCERCDSNNWHKLTRKEKFNEWTHKCRKCGHLQELQPAKNILINIVPKG